MVLRGTIDALFGIALILGAGLWLVLVIERYRRRKALDEGYRQAIARGDTEVATGLAREKAAMTRAGRAWLRKQGLR